MYVDSNTISLAAAIEGDGIYLDRLADGSGSLGNGISFKIHIILKILPCGNCQKYSNISYYFL